MPTEGFIPDHAGIRALLNTRGVQDGALRTAQGIERTARSLAPSGTGSYASAFRSRTLTVPTLTAGGGRELRAGAAVENTSPQAPTVEARSHVLARAARTAR